MAIAIIPARAGSQRIPNKNIKEFRGKPIIEYSMDEAERSGLFEKIYVTSDNPEILEIAKKKNHAAIFREPYYAQNDVGTQEVTRRTIEHINPYMDDIVCCIYPTSPLLSKEDLWRGLGLLKSNRNMNYAFSVGVAPLRDAGMFYFGYSSAFLKRLPLISSDSIMVPISEDRVCDINTPEDWNRAEQMYDRLHGVNNER